ncbi:hypothetical protein [Herbiconiux daphne]|uniref:DUF4235 domain-containing protein n=1 Tax=Herbiconiux daphne TaxID=2970914 RepID=A0ABT2H9A0_9MICO|nr:hypothetical protein [Herbiconiux daphne]MCS5736531.1 hypothetical protein [Herbiconiux daphne]
MAKDTIGNYIEKGFYTGAAATVGLLVVAAAPEIAIAVTVGVVAYKGAERFSDQVSRFKRAWKESK